MKVGCKGKWALPILLLIIFCGCGTLHHMSPSTKSKAATGIKELVITPKLQQGKFDCGQTVLDMLGYDGHGMFPTGEVTSDMLRSIPGTKELTLPVGREEEIDYNYPKVWSVLGKGVVKGKMHWVIRHKETIYCPTRGVMSSKKFKKKYVAFILQEFEIPVKGQLTPEEYYQQFSDAKDTQGRPTIDKR